LLAFFSSLFHSSSTEESRLSSLLPSDKSLVVALPVTMVKHEVVRYTLGISTLESKSMDYKLRSCNTTVEGGLRGSCLFFHPEREKEGRHPDVLVASQA
jgi:hypothetical protein